MIRCLKLLMLVLLPCCLLAACSREEAAAPIPVGVLHSLTGTMAISEQSVVDATLLAIEEINARGGVLGRQIQPVVVDGESDWPTFAARAEELITGPDPVAVVFGCWTSASRKTVKPIFEKHDHLLFYPVQYEGLEQSPNIVYTGAAPNQQIIPAVNWAFDELGTRFFLVGSDYVFPRTANAIIRDVVETRDGQILGEEYVLLGDTAVDEIVKKIADTRPDVILNTINGDSNLAFFRALRAAGITPEQIPTISFSIAEEELRGLDVQSITGDYAAWNYFMSIESEENRRFVQAFRARYGSDRVTTDPMEAAYIAVNLWANAAEEAKSVDPREIRRVIGSQSFAAPEGYTYLEAENQHLWKVVRIGRIRSDAQFDIVWSTERPIRPVPFPQTRTRADWEAFLQSLNDGWGGAWANPGPVNP